MRNRVLCIAIALTSTFSVTTEALFWQSASSQVRATAVTAAPDTVFEKGLLDDSNPSRTPPFAATLPTRALAQTRMNFSLLAGEWSERGKCNATRHVFLSDGRYRWLERKQEGWKPRFDGVYTTKDPNLVAVAQRRNTDGNYLEVSSLTQTALKGVWKDSDEEGKSVTVSWIRCPDSR